MRIKRIEIGAFGKFKEFSMDFSEGFNLIYGKNEDGKSTVMAFIALMLYGSAGTAGRTDISKNIRKKYMPWSGEKMSGDMEIEVKGRTYRIHKDFKATAKSDNVSITDMETGEKLNLPPGTEIGKHFLGLDYQGFEKSVFGSGAEPLAGSENADISARLANISESGDENISPQIAILRLEKAKEELVSKRGNKGRLVEVNNRIEVLTEQIFTLKAKEDRRSALKAEYEGAEQELKALGERAEKARKNAEIKEKQQQVGRFRRLAEMLGEVELKDKEIKDKNRVTREDLENFARLKSEKAVAEEHLKLVIKTEEKTENKRQARFKSALFLGTTIGLAGIIGGIFSPWLLALTAIGIGAVALAFIARKRAGGNEIDSAKEGVLKATAKAEEFLREKNCESGEQLESLYRQGIALEEEVKILNKNIEAFRKNYEIFQEDRVILINLAQDIENELPKEIEVIDAESVQRQIALKNSRLLEIKGQIGETADIGSLERELLELKRKSEEMTAYYKALSVASEVMAESAEDMSRSFAPRLRDRASQLLGRLTKGKYSGVSVSKTYEIEVKTGDAGAYRQWQYLSRGTCAQGYLALRLALCEMLEDDGVKIPVILDDVLSDYDEEREAETADFLEEYANGGRQVLFFTCHNWQGKAEKKPLI